MPRGEICCKAEIIRLGKTGHEGAEYLLFTESLMDGNSTAQDLNGREDVTVKKIKLLL